MATTIAASSGMAVSMLTSAFHYKGQFDPCEIGNGILAGLVSITAGCAVVTPHEAMVIGLLGGVIVSFGMKLVDRLKIDDPIGVLPVHLMCGAAGTFIIRFVEVSSNNVTLL